MRRNNVLMVLFIAVMAVMAVVSYFYLPERIPIHWNVAGEIDNYAGRLFIFLPSVLGAGVALLLKFTQRIDPNSDNYGRFQKSYDLFGVLICGLFLVLEAVTIYSSFYPQVKLVDKVVPFSIGLMFLVIGNMMPKFRPNYFVGIKTPWTLANEEVWTKTHRIAGRIWFAGGLVLAAVSFIGNGVMRAAVFSAVIAALVIIPLLYSYLTFRKLKKESK